MTWQVISERSSQTPGMWPHSDLIDSFREKVEAGTYWMAQLVKVLRGLTRMSNEQMQRAEIMVTGFVTKLSAYPPLVAAEVVNDWTETQEFFPGSWATLKNELDYVMGALEAYAR